jgi:hypothetical protein
MLEQIVQWIESNPDKDLSIDPIIVKIISDNDEANPTPAIGPGKVSIIPLDPPGPVSLYLWHTNPEYRAGSFLTRKTILRSMIVTLNERFQDELKGRAWNRKKSIEELQLQDTSAVSPQQNLPDLSKALAYVLGFQYVELNENSKKIILFPSDVRQWSKDIPIYIASYGCRSLYIQGTNEEARPIFKKWFTDLINIGYNYEWPIAEGTLKQIKEIISTNMLIVNLDTKAKKDDYSKEVGKAQAIRHINNEF